MKKLSLNKCVDKINKEAVKAFLSSVLYHDNWRDGPLGEWLECGLYLISLDADGILIRQNDFPAPEVCAYVDYRKIDTIRLEYAGAPHLLMRISPIGGPEIVLYDQYMNLKREIYEMIERDDPEEFEW